MTTYKPGDIVNITIEGARVIEVCRHGDGNGDDLRFTYEAKDGDPWPNSVWAQAPGVTVERVTPAEWPPRHHDVWRDRFGDLWIARVLLSTPDDRTHIEMHGVGDDVFAADTMLAKYGPMTLVHREDDR